MCACGKKKTNGSVRHFSTEQQARIARERGVGVTTSAKRTDWSKINNQSSTSANQN